MITTPLGPEFVKNDDQSGAKSGDHTQKSPDVRLGGIYGLEQLARDSPSDHPAVFDVLAAFVRGHVPAGPVSAPIPICILAPCQTLLQMRTFKQRSMLSRGAMVQTTEKASY